jgi:two-component system, response regulator PdtaR
MVSSISSIAIGSLTVLVAEDDAWVQELISAKLRAHRYRVIAAASGDHALAVLQAGGIDVLVTDIAMPGALDGWALGEQARLMHPTLAVVYVSSRPAIAARQVSHSLYLQKPFRPDAIIAAIRHVTS